MQVERRRSWVQQSSSLRVLRYSLVQQPGSVQVERRRSLVQQSSSLGIWRYSLMQQPGRQ